jgi:hypothetical protein
MPDTTNFFAIRCTTGVFSTIQITTPCITDAMIAVAAKISASKLQHQHALHHSQANGVDVASETKLAHIVLGATGVVTAVQVSCAAKPTGTSAGTDKKFTVDVQVGSNGVGFTSIMTGVITIDQTIANLQVVSGALIPTPALVAGQTMRVVITASGSTGTQGQGMTVTITTNEDAQ